MKIRIAVALAVSVLVASTLSAQCVALTGATYTQNFDSLASSGTSGSVPGGWAFAETGTNANALYTAGTGSSNAGDTYSFGSTGSTDRAFGTLLSGSLTPTIGACFTNNTGTTLTSLNVAYTGEQWRLGTSGRADRLDFQYSTSATSLTTGTWTDVDALDFSSPNITAAVGALDGNASGNRSAISSTISALAIPDGATFWIRWSDFNASGADDGLGVDDFSLSTGGSVVSSISINDVTANEGDSGTTTFHFTVSLTPAAATDVTFDISTADGTATAGSDYVAKSLTAQTIPAGSTSYGFDVLVNGDTTFENDETFVVNVANVTPGINVVKAQGTGTIQNDDSSGPPLVPPGTVVISQVYGGGGNSGATIKNDFVELYNRSNADVLLDGWSVQYTGATASFPNGLTPLTGTIHAHSYFLVGEAAGAGGTVDLPTPDVIGAIPMGATAGKIALVQSAVGLSGSCPTGANISDFVGYGNASCSEGTATGLLSNTTAVFRLLGGCKDNNANATDSFVAPPAPRNSASPAGPDCSSAVETFTPHVMITQVYGGGGNSGATFSNDFVELYNPTSASVDLTNWSIQYTSSTGNTWGTSTVPIGGTIDPGEYFLIALASGGSNGTALPSARVNGDINLSASSGKVLLARTTDGLIGNCPVGDPSLVDLVGYGAADCYEGGLNAPGLSNTTALIRNGDTNQNSVDFATGTPDPQRGSGAPIDLPPFITSVDPVGADAPFDASITINFSKSVNVSGSWYSIACSQTGIHSDVVVNPAFGQTAYILTPNVTFAPSENCSVHIAKDLVVESSGLAQSLTEDTDFTFTIASGPDSTDSSDLSLVMGNPTNASLADPDNYLMTKPEFTESYNRDSGRPNWVSWHLTDAWSPSANATGRTDTFRPDPAIPSDWYRVLHTDFSGSGFDRGHMCPSADRTADVAINEATFLMSNMVAQAPDNNQGPWETLESYLRTLLPANDVYIVAGPAGQGGIGSNGPCQPTCSTTMTVANGHVVVPAYTWKAALVVPKGLTNPSSVTAGTRTIAVIMPNVQGIRGDDWTKYVTTVDAVESLCSCQIFSNVPDAVRNAINGGTNGVNPPGAGNESVSDTEDTPVSFALSAASPDGSALTYNIVTGPAHGTLSGTDANQTYTPAPDFNGTDSVTFSVTNGSTTSNTATVTISVSEVNDPPVGADDVKSIDEDTTLTFPASDLTTNDSAGPANESSQTLTVTSVGTATHGAVSLASGQITYVPSSNYNGPDAFTYTVCDNGTTAGVSDSKCATATVNVTVNPVDDAPTIAAVGDKTIVGGTTLTFTATASDVDSTNLTFTLDGAPAGAAIGATTGVFTWTPTAAQFGAAYTFHVVVSDGSLTAQTPVTVVVEATPAIHFAGGPFTYDGTPKSFAVSVVPAVSGSFIVTYDGSPAPPTAAGAHNVVALFTSSDPLYTNASATAVLTINPATLTIRANDAFKLFTQTLTFNGSEFTATGLAAGDSVSSVTLASAGSAANAAAGSYDIVPSAAIGSGLSNYTIVYQNGTLTVAPAGFVALDTVLISGNALFDSFDSTVGPYSKTTATDASSLTANGGVIVNGGTVKGSVLSTGGSVTLQAASVTGDVSAGTTITKNASRIDGTLTDHHPFPAIAASPVASCGAFSGTSGITGHFTYDAAHGDLTISGNNTVTLAAGSYCFHNVTLTGASALTVAGPVALNLTGELTASGNVMINATHNPANLQIATSHAGGSGVLVSGTGSIYASIYAPASGVTTSGNVAFFGSLFAKSLTISGNPGMHYDTSLEQVWGARVPR
ncbi:MAG TPA: DNA/RNA non-specific endonuclease [Thermoanaerobaculia bacterium]|nr:DNA/RNA non-specific endonuclease [Thermoanaerobaculia bacterium]